MAGRATPPASCLASAQPSVSSRPRQRPRFARIPSASRSTYASVSAAQAARSDESLTTTLNSLGLDDGTKYIDSPSSTGIDSGAGSDVGSPARPALGMYLWNARPLPVRPCLQYISMDRSAGFPKSTKLPSGNTGQEKE